VVDHTGQVFGHPGLYVADGSLYPAAPGVPPDDAVQAASLAVDRGIADYAMAMDIEGAIRPLGCRSTR
jgi:choline dehydrogenase-like flavoprotein